MEPPDKRGGQHQAGNGHSDHDDLSRNQTLEGEDGEPQVHTWAGLKRLKLFWFKKSQFSKFFGIESVKKIVWNKV